MKDYNYRSMNEYITYTGTSTNTDINDYKGWYASGTGYVTDGNSSSTSWIRNRIDEKFVDQEPPKLDVHEPFNELASTWKELSDRLELNSTQRENKVRNDQLRENKLNKNFLDELKLRGGQDYVFPQFHPFGSFGSDKPRRIKTKAVLVEREIEDDDDLTLIR